MLCCPDSYRDENLKMKVKRENKSVGKNKKKSASDLNGSYNLLLQYLDKVIKEDHDLLLRLAS